MVHLQTNFDKYPLPRARQRPGRAAGGAPGEFFQNVFKNKPYLAHPIFKIAIWLVSQSFNA